MIIKEYSCTADTAVFRRKMFVLNFCKNQSENFILFLLQYKKDLKVSLMTNIPVPIVQILIDLRKNIYFPNLIRARDILPSFLILFAFKYIPQHACNLAPPWRSLIQELAKYTPSIINLLKSLGAKLWSQLGKNNDDLSPPIIQHVAATKKCNKTPFPYHWYCSLVHCSPDSHHCWGLMPARPSAAAQHRTPAAGPSPSCSSLCRCRCRRFHRPTRRPSRTRSRRRAWVSTCDTGQWGPSGRRSSSPSWWRDDASTPWRTDAEK